MTDKGPILVIGAPGNQGRHVVGALLAEGRTVHALTRHPTSPQARALEAKGARLVQGDLADPHSLIAAVQPVSGIFNVQNFWDFGMGEEVRLGRNVIRAATAAGHHPHIVYSSGLGAETPQDVAAIDGKAAVEQHLRESGLPFTFLRPGLFMDDFRGTSLPFSRPVQRVLRDQRPLVGRLFLATLRAVMPHNHPVPLTSLSDLGCMAVWAFQHPDAARDQAYLLVSTVDTADTLCELWEQYVHQSSPRLPSLRWGIRVAHPQMAALLKWIGRREVTRSHVPIALQSYERWLTAAGQHL